MGCVYLYLCRRSECTYSQVNIGKLCHENENEEEENEREREREAKRRKEK